MKSIILYLSLALLTMKTYGHGSELDLISIVDMGYSTRWDIEKKLGGGEFIENKILDPDIEHDQEERNHVQNNGLLFENLGVLYTCANDGELIEGIQFMPPFSGNFGLKKDFVIGSTTLSEIIPQFDSLEFSTTGGSKYYSFGHGQFQFYILKPTEDMDKAFWSHVPKVTERLDYYSKQPIAKITTRFYDYEKYEREIQEQENEIYCSAPFYAPKNETHINCHTRTWPKEIRRFKIPFYAMLGGVKSEHVKQGLWKEYWPSHHLKYIGEFMDGKEIGEFKYFDINGNLTKTENFKKSKSKFPWYIFGVIGIVSLLLILKIK